jgi:transposase
MELDYSMLHTDTTNFSVWGKYDSIGRKPDDETIEITYGPSKDKRKDLKRFALSLICNSNGIPLFMEPNSGNSSDHETLKTAMSRIKTELINCLKSKEKIHYIGDAALYTSANIKEFDFYWVTRVPGTINEAKDLLKVEDGFEECKEDKKYSFIETKSKYADIDQKWVLYKSEPMVAKDEETLLRKIEKQLQKSKKSIKNLCSQKFETIELALNEADIFIEKFPLVKFTNLNVLNEKKRISGLKGRPKCGELLKDVYFIEAEIGKNIERIEEERLMLGKFILATNDLDLSAFEILKKYKKQTLVERGFRFIKVRNFQLGYTFLKNPKRIESLTFLLVMCLLMYSILELNLRNGLKEKGLTVPNYKKGKTNKPSFESIIYWFDVILENTIVTSSGKKKIFTNVPDESPVWPILSALGAEYLEFYSEHNK